MPISATRYIKADTVRNLGVVRDDFEISDLTRIQTESYARFLQLDRGPRERKSQGLEEILREVFPIESYDGQYRLEYLRYELGKPRYEPDECRQLRLTYGRPFRVWLRLTKAEPVEEEVYLGDMPIMLGGGEFIINGAERVVVSQLHRSPGVDFVSETDTTDRKLHSCRIIPERGSWIELNVSKKDTLTVRIDQSGKFPVTTLIRALFPHYATNEEIIRKFYPTSKIKLSAKDSAARLKHKVVVSDIVDPETGEIKLEGGGEVSDKLAEELKDLGMKEIEIIDDVKDWLILNTLKEDPTRSHDEAL